MQCCLGSLRQRAPSATANVTAARDKPCSHPCLFAHSWQASILTLTCPFLTFTLAWKLIPPRHRLTQSSLTTFTHPALSKALSLPMHPPCGRAVSGGLATKFFHSSNEACQRIVPLPLHLVWKIRSPTWQRVVQTLGALSWEFPMRCEPPLVSKPYCQLAVHSTQAADTRRSAKLSNKCCGFSQIHCNVSE